MAEKTEFLQAIDDAILDADSLERFINGGDSETVLTRLSAEYPTLQKAIKTIFEIGGLPATPFKTIQEMQASDLPSDSYAIVTDNGDEGNGLYYKESETWIKSKYDTTGLVDLATAFTVQTNSAVSANSVNTTTFHSHVTKDPSAALGNNLLNYMGIISAWIDEDDKVHNLSAPLSTKAVKKIIGKGKYPIQSTNLIGYHTVPKRLSWEGQLLVPKAAPELAFSYADGMVEDIKEARTVTFWAAGYFTDLLRGGDTIVDFGDTALRLFSSGKGDNKSYIRLIAKNPNGVEDDYTTLMEWTCTTTGLRVGSRYSSVTKEAMATVEATFDNVTGEVTLLLDNEKTPVTKASADGFFIKDIESVVLSREQKIFTETTPTRSAIYANAVIINNMPGIGEVFWEYLNRDLYYIYPEYRGDNSRRAQAPREFAYRNYNPTPTTLAGSFSVAEIEPNNHLFTIVEQQAGNAPVVTVPSSPNVQPWNQPHDPTKLEASILRFNALPHPDDPTNTNKVLAIAGSVFYKVSGYYSMMLAFESNDGGANFTPIALDNPGRDIPPEATNTINNIVTPGFMRGRYIYIGDHFPGGYKPEGSNNAFTYLYLEEMNYKLYGCTDPRDFSTYEVINMNRQGKPYYHPTTGNIVKSVVSDDRWAAEKGHQEMMINEEKVIKYDPVSQRFYRIGKFSDVALDSPLTTQGNERYTRHLCITWSEVNDVTRWGPYERIIPARRAHYQAYDLDVIEIRDNCWALLVFRYTDFDTARVAVEDLVGPYADQHIKMSVDLYVTHDQFKTPPILVREDWISNKEQVWASGTLWAYEHPFDKGKVYISGAEGAHGGVLPYTDTLDYKSKIAMVEVDWPLEITSDGSRTNGLVRSRPMDGSKVDKVYVDTREGTTMVRVLDMNGAAIPGYDFDSYGRFDSDGLAMWNGVLQLPNCIVQLEAMCINSVFSGMYPMKEHYKLY